MAIQSASLVTTTLNCSGAHPKQRSQFLSSIASSPSAPAAPEIFDAIHVTSSSVKSRGTVLGTSPYSSKAVHMGFSTGGHACLDASPGGPLQPVARFWCIGHLGGYTPPPPCRLPDGRPAKAYLTTPCCGSSRIPPHPPPPHHWRTCPPWKPLPRWRLLPVPRGDPSPRGPSAALAWPGSIGPYGRPTSS